MNWIQKIIGLVAGQNSFLRNIFILLIITRLIFLEDSQLALILEIIGGLIVLVTNKAENNVDD